MNQCVKSNYQNTCHETCFCLLPDPHVIYHSAGEGEGKFGNEQMTHAAADLQNMRQTPSARQTQNEKKYRVTHPNNKNLPLTYFQQFRQLAGRYCGYLLHSQDGGTSQI